MHLGKNFKKYGNIADDEGHYILEKFPKINYNNNYITQYNLRPYINNEYHNYYDFVYQVKKDAYKKYVEECMGPGAPAMIGFSSQILNPYFFEAVYRYSREKAGE